MMTITLERPCPSAILSICLSVYIYPRHWRNRLTRTNFILSFAPKENQVEVRQLFTEGSKDLCVSILKVVGTEGYLVGRRKMGDQVVLMLTAFRKSPPVAKEETLIRVGKHRCWYLPSVSLSLSCLTL